MVVNFFWVGLELVMEGLQFIQDTPRLFVDTPSLVVVIRIELY